MSAAPISPDTQAAIAQAALGEKAIRPTRDPERTNIDERAEKLIQAAQQGEAQGWQPALETEAIRPVRHADADAIVEQMTTKRNPDGTKDRNPATNPKEAPRHKAAVTNKDRVIAAIEGGKTELKRSGQIGEARKLVYEIVKTRREFASRITDSKGNVLPVGDVRVEAIIDELLDSEDFRGSLRSMYEEFKNSDRSKIGDTTTIDHAKAEVEKAQIDYEQAKHEHDDQKAILTQTESELQSFREDSSGVAGKNLQRIRDLPGLISTEEGKVSSAKGLFESEKRKYDKLQTEYNNALAAVKGTPVADIPTKLAALGFRDPSLIKTDIDAIDLATLEKDYLEAQARRDSLSKEQERLENQRKQVETDHRQQSAEVRRLEAEMKKKHLDVTEREQLYRDAVGVRAAQEQDIVDGFGNLIGEAANDTLNKRIKKLVTSVQTEATKQEDEASQKVDEAVRNALAKRWNGANEDYDKRKITKDYYAMLEYGPDQIVENILDHALANGEITHEQYQQKLDDKKWREGKWSDVAGAVLTKRIQTGKITPYEARQIADSTWGEGMITKAIDRSDRAKKELLALRERGVLRGNLLEWMRHQTDGNLLKLLLMILAIPAVPLVGLSMFMRDEMRQ